MKKILASTILILAMFATSCAAGFDRQEAIDDFVGEGMSREVAECAVDGLIDEMGEEKLGSRGTPTDAEEAKALEIMFSCLSS